MSNYCNTPCWEYKGWEPNQVFWTLKPGCTLMPLSLILKTREAAIPQPCASGSPEGQEWQCRDRPCWEPARAKTLGAEGCPQLKTRLFAWQWVKIPVQTQVLPLERAVLILYKFNSQCLCVRQCSIALVLRAKPQKEKSLSSNPDL